jgi:2-polyprenyl-3-methyl-5-hydroxy-6-metoxy-1,4-benzoquinol methylase
MPHTKTHDYNSLFFDYVEAGSRRAARHIIPFLLRHLPLSSVIDVGCGRGVWVEEWRRNGVEDAIGADGDYVDRNRLLIPKERFSAFDLAQGFNLGRRFDLVQSLEVAEHIPASQADRLIESLTRTEHSKQPTSWRDIAAEGAGGAA